MLAARRKGGERFFVSLIVLRVVYVWSESEDETAEA